MNIINPSEIKNIEEVRLNHKGKIIGHIVKYKDNYYYLSPRTDEHFFIKFNGFGVDSGLLKAFIERKIQSQIQARYGIKAYIKGIIIHYKGKKENRYYYANMDTWFMDSQTYGTAKVSNQSTETYGIQKILSKKFMKVLGYDLSDYQIAEYKKRWVR